MSHLTAARSVDSYELHISSACVALGFAKTKPISFVHIASTGLCRFPGSSPHLPSAAASPPQGFATLPESPNTSNRWVEPSLLISACIKWDSSQYPQYPKLYANFQTHRKEKCLSKNNTNKRGLISTSLHHNGHQQVTLFLLFCIQLNRTCCCKYFNSNKMRSHFQERMSSFVPSEATIATDI